MFLLQVLPVLGLYSAPPKLKHFQFQTATAEVAATFPTARKGLSRGAASAVCVFSADLQPPYLHTGLDIYTKAYTRTCRKG